MKESTYKKKLELIEFFFNDVKKTAQSLGEQQFPKIKILDDRVNKVLKMKAGKEKADKKKDIQQIMKIAVSELHDYFIPEASFLKLNKKNFDLWLVNESKKDKERTNIDKKIEKLTAEILQLEELSFEHKEDREKMVSFLNDKTLYKLQEKRDKIIASYSDSFYLPRLEEINQNKLSLKKLTYFIKLSRNKDLLEQYNKYWSQLYQYVSQFGCIEQDLYNKHIAVSSFWTEYQTQDLYTREFIREVNGEPETVKVIYTGKSKGKLAELYKRLVEKEYIEAGKEDAFIAIFSGFYLDYEYALPIKWKCSISRMGDLDINNLTVLYYLITALRNWRHFCYWSESPKECFIQDILTSEDRELLTKYFIHENEEQINIKSLKIGFPINKRAVSIIKELIEPFYNEADKYL